MKYRLAIFLGILLLLTLYTGFKVGKLLPDNKLLIWFATILTVVVAVSGQFFYRTNPQYVNEGWFHGFIWLSVVVMAVWATFLLVSLPFDIVQLFFVGFQKLYAADTNTNLERRELFSRLSFGLFGLSGIIAGLGLRQALAGAKVQDVEVPIKNLPPALNGFKITQISDLHVGPTIQRDYVNRIVSETLKLKPDVIVITGDLGDGSPELLAEHLKPLSELKSVHGIYYVTGNHEYYWDVDQWLNHAAKLGFTPLLNENRILKVADAKILLAGVTDTSAHMFKPGHKSDPARAIAAKEKCDVNILLAHRPDSCFEAEPLGFHLQLSGHTHAGQFVPWNFLVKLAHKYYRGLNRHGNMWVYVNAGTGYWGPPHRFAVPAEISLIRLAPA